MQWNLELYWKRPGAPAWPPALESLGVSTASTPPKPVCVPGSTLPHCRGQWSVNLAGGAGAALIESRLATRLVTRECI